MIATRTARQERRYTAERRDPIAFLLFYRMDWCERHPGLMFLAIGGLILLEAVLEQVFQ